MKIALAQYAMQSDWRENLKKVIALMKEAAAGGAGMICFPELQLSPFFPQHRKARVPEYIMDMNHPAVQKLREQCAELKQTAVLNIYLKENGKLYDASPVINSDGSLLGISKMVHITQIPNFYEQDYYAPSDTGFQVYETKNLKIGVVICFDRHFPESVRICALKGAEVVVIPTANLKGEPVDLFIAEMRAAALQNTVYIALCNRVGKEDAVTFAGASVVVDPNGSVIAEAGDGEQMLYAEVRAEVVEKTRRERPWLKMRRPHLYDL